MPGGWDSADTGMGLRAHVVYIGMVHRPLQLGVLESRGKWVQMWHLGREWRVFYPRSPIRSHSPGVFSALAHCCVPRKATPCSGPSIVLFSKDFNSSSSASGSSASCHRPVVPWNLNPAFLLSSVFYIPTWIPPCLWTALRSLIQTILFRTENVMTSWAIASHLPHNFTSLGVAKGQAIGLKAEWLRRLRMTGVT